MKITNQTSNYSIYKQKPRNPAFKGYFAAPIKELHVQPSCQDKKAIFLIKELEEKCGKYFDIVIQLRDKVTKSAEELALDNFGYIRGSNFTKWGQDNKLFFENGKLGILEDADLMSHARGLAKALKLDIEKIGAKIEGGNCFLGKKENGDTFALVGTNTINGSNKNVVAKSLHVKPENLHVISQPDFHIDMAIRPLVYPYVLVGDDRLTLQLASKKVQQCELELLNKSRAQYSKENCYCSPDQIINELTQQGFKPIRVPGFAGIESVNFMNAIVHQNDDGSLLYITNKPSKAFSNRIGFNFEDMFKKYLQKEIPKIKEVTFIDGNDATASCLLSGGGIHCLTSERPNFEKWNRMLKK